jgi:predicted esterase
MRVGLLPSVVLLLAFAHGAAGQYVTDFYTIPVVDGVKADGDGADWRDGGFRIETLAPADGRIVPSTRFDATVRLARTDNGLAVLVTVVDSTPVTREDLNAGDSVEFYVGDAARPHAGTIRYIAAPGDKDTHPDTRFRIDNSRADASSKEKPFFWVGWRATAAGYRIEAIIPTEAGKFPLFQVVVNDAHDGKRSRYVWYPADDTAANAAHAYGLRVDKSPSPPVTTALVAAYDGLHRGRVTLLTNSDLLGHRVEVGTGPPLKEAARSADPQLPLAIGKVTSIEDRTGAYLTFPIAPLGKPYGPLNVYVDSKPAGKLTPVDIEARRRHALAQVDIKFEPAVFSGESFPRCDFADPALARELIGGEYSMKTTFFDADHRQVEKPDKPGRYGAVVWITTDTGVTLPLRLVTLFKLKERGANENDLDLHAALPPQIGVDPKVVEEQQPALAELLTERFVDGFGNEPDTPLLLAALAESKPGEGRLAGKNSIWARDQRWWHPIKEKLGIARYKCLIDLPEGYHSGEQKYPLLLFLHGSGERGDDVDTLRENGPPKVVKEMGATGELLRGHGAPGFIVVSPQCRAGEWWCARDLAAVLDEAEMRFRVDPERVYVTGLSMGGYGTWELAEEYPDRFAAIAPVCGAGNPDAAKRLKDLPAWVFHGQRDTVVPFKRSQDMVNALKKAGGRVRFTAYPDRGHDCWTPTYANTQLYDWLLKQKRGAPDEPPARP